MPPSAAPARFDADDRTTGEAWPGSSNRHQIRHNRHTSSHPKKLIKKTENSRHTCSAFVAHIIRTPTGEAR
jgi:hypothetical protein